MLQRRFTLTLPPVTPVLAWSTIEVYESITAATQRSESWALKTALRQNLEPANHATKGVPPGLPHTEVMGTTPSTVASATATR